MKDYSPDFDHQIPHQSSFFQSLCPVLHHPGYYIQFQLIYSPTSVTRNEITKIIKTPERLFDNFYIDSASSVAFFPLIKFLLSMTSEFLSVPRGVASPRHSKEIARQWKWNAISGVMKLMN